MAITTDLLETDIVLFYSATSEWWYEAREYIPSKGPSVSRFGSIPSLKRRFRRKISFESIFFPSPKDSTQSRKKNKDQ
ncbi:hypothetical protein V1477_021127 [Vespula maculifrons]|uniref:Uncharacterized protein n=1 Tax=Vespula maculifrons TaxID=7453 RepID=A0ABD2AJF6_VESMC